ncbi:MAG: redoxin domain-containing protein [Tepidisphaeraceae bacterium]
MNQGFFLRAVPFLVAALAGARCFAAANHPQPLEIGQSAPDFKLPGVDGKTHSLADFASARILVIVFTCDHCPTAQAYEDRLIQLQRDYQDRGVTVVAICPNDPKAIRLDELNYSDLTDTLGDMMIRAKDKGFNFPYLYDGDTQSTAIAYGPLATPHVFIFDQARKLRYQGRIDNADVGKITSTDARNAIDALLAGKPVSVEKTRVFGCSIKWSDKRQSALHALKKWDAEPVTLDTIDAPAAAKLAKNPTKNLLLVNLWATWCAPCVQEMPELVTMNRMYRSRDFQFITISIDEPDQKAQALERLSRDHVSATNYLYDSTDRDKLAEALDPQWAGPVPYTLLIAPGGQIIYRHDGPIEPLEVKRAIVDYLGRTAAGRSGK